MPTIKWLVELSAQSPTSPLTYQEIYQCPQIDYTSTLPQLPPTNESLSSKTTSSVPSSPKSLPRLTNWKRWVITYYGAKTPSPASMPSKPVSSISPPSTELGTKTPLSNPWMGLWRCRLSMRPRLRPLNECPPKYPAKYFRAKMPCASAPIICAPTSSPYSTKQTSWTTLSNYTRRYTANAPNPYATPSPTNSRPPCSRNCARPYLTGPSTTT